jgi:hypothetical protein
MRFIARPKETSGLTLFTFGHETAEQPHFVTSDSLNRHARDDEIGMLSGTVIQLNFR